MLENEKIIDGNVTFRSISLLSLNFNYVRLFNWILKKKSLIYIIYGKGASLEEYVAFVSNTIGKIKKSNI